MFQADHILGFNTKERERDSYNSRDRAKDWFLCTTWATVWGYQWKQRRFVVGAALQFGAYVRAVPLWPASPLLTRHVLLLDPTSHWFTVWEVILFPDAMDSTIWVIATTVEQWHFHTLGVGHHLASDKLQVPPMYGQLRSIVWRPRVLGIGAIRRAFRGVHHPPLYHQCHACSRLSV